MIDLILCASTKADMIRWAKARNLLIPDGEGGFTPKPGLALSWWAGNGKMMIKQLISINYEFFDRGDMRPSSK